MLLSPITSEVRSTSNPEKMAGILEELKQTARVNDLVDRLDKLHTTTKKHECVYDVWTQRVDRRNVTFGFLVYTCDGPDNVPTAGMELLMSTSKRKVEKMCRTIKDTIWIPTDLAMSKERFASLDCEDGIFRD
jgi:hypothetical protein